MASGFEDQAKIKALPQEGVHCFPANSKQIVSRRIITGILFVAFAAMAVYGFMKMGTLVIAAGIGALGALVTLLVFIQTFLIAKYRVAVDYNEKNVVLRFRYSNIKIPFENFDARDGEPDRAEKLIDNNLGTEKAMYLVLDNVFEDACFQTSTRDLASTEDFKQLRSEAFAIAEAYGARNSEDKVRFWNESEKQSDLDEDDIEAIVEAAANGDDTPVVETKTETLSLEKKNDSKKPEVRKPEVRVPDLKIAEKDEEKASTPEVETRESRKANPEDL